MQNAVPERVSNLKVDNILMNFETMDVKYVFDVFAEKYDKWYEKPFGKSAFKLEKACIESLCKDLKRPLLEVGVGTGRFAHGLNIDYGVDLSTGVLFFAKNRGIKVGKGSGEKLPFKNKVFGGVFLIVTLCFVDNPLKVLEESARVLIDDGSIILGLILKESPWARFYKEKARKGNIFYKIARFYSLKEIEAMLAAAKLKIVEVSSTIFEAPAERPLRFQLPRRGYYKEAGFTALKVKKAFKRNYL